MLQSYPYNKKTVILPIRAPRVIALQAALEQGLPIIAILSDGLIIECSKEHERLNRELELFKRRVHMLACSTALQWKADKWIEEGFSLRKLHPKAHDPEKDFRRWRSVRPRIVIHSRHMVY